MNTFKVIESKTNKVLFENKSYIACEMAMDKNGWFWNNHKIIPELPSKFEGYLITDGELFYIENPPISIEKVKRVGEPKCFVIRTPEIIQVFNYLKRHNLSLNLNKDHKGLMLEVFYSDMLQIVKDLRKEKVYSPYIDTN